MLEKIKDILYETSDLLLALVILLVMSSVITWQVTDSMAFSNQSNISENENVEVVNNESISTSFEPDESNNLQEETTQPENDELELPENINFDNESPIQPIVDEPVLTPVEPTPNVTVTVEIPSGTPGIGIAKILKEKKLIEDTSVFVSRVEELNLAVKLKSGTYGIDSNASLDDIIYAITGQKR